MSAGGQRKPYKDTLKVILNNFQIDLNTLEDTAAEGSKWNSLVEQVDTGYEESHYSLHQS